MKNAVWDKSLVNRELCLGPQSMTPRGCLWDFRLTGLIMIFYCFGFMFALASGIEVVCAPTVVRRRSCSCVRAHQETRTLFYATH
jgi:hypothetical protein